MQNAVARPPGRLAPRLASWPPLVTQWQNSVPNNGDSVVTVTRRSPDFVPTSMFNLIMQINLPLLALFASTRVSSLDVSVSVALFRILLHEYSINDIASLIRFNRNENFVWDEFWASNWYSDINGYCFSIALALWIANATRMKESNGAPGPSRSSK